MDRFDCSRLPQERATQFLLAAWLLIYIYLLYNVLRVSLVRLKNSRFALRVESQR